MLKKTPFSISYDLPKEINEARKKLWGEVKSIKANQPNAKYQILYPAKLLVEGKVIQDEFPDWNETMKGSRLCDFSHIDINFGLDQPNVSFFEQKVNSQQSSQQLTKSNTREHSTMGVFMNESLSRGDNMDIESEGSNGSRRGLSMHSCVNVQSHTQQQECEYDDETVPKSVVSESVSRAKQNENESTCETISSSEKSDKTILQPPIFRPYDNDSSILVSSQKSGHASSTYKQNELTAENSYPKEHISRPKQRGQRRAQSQSLTRTNRRTALDFRNPSNTKNRQTCATVNNESRVSSPGGDKNSATDTHL